MTLEAAPDIGVRVIGEGWVHCRLASPVVVVHRLANKLYRILGKVSVELEVFGLAQFCVCQTTMAYLQKTGAGDSHEDRRVGRHDDLGCARNLDGMQKAKEVNLPFRRKRTFRFIQQIQSLSRKALFEETNKALAMAKGQEVRRCGIGIACGFIKVTRDGEEGFGPKEPACGDLGQPGGAQDRGQRRTASIDGARVIDRPVSLATAGLVKAANGGHGLDQRGFASTIFANEDRHRRRQFEDKILPKPW